MPATLRPVAVRVHAQAARRVRQGHPWIFDGAITHQSRDGAAGDLAVVYDPSRKQIALGLYDPHSPVRVRVLHAGGPVAVDDAFFAARVHAAIARRAPLADRGDTDGYRLVHGENDGLPALVADRYADTLVVKLYSAAWSARLPQVLAPLEQALRPANVILRLSRHAAAVVAPPLRDGMALRGGAATVLFRENGLRFEVDPVHGQKTGFFLDQRDNRAMVETLCDGAEVLNAFSYTGGFSLYAARGAARRVVSLDASRPALDAAERNFGHNDLRTPHETLCADAFTALARRRRRFDVVVIDPPAFAQRERDVRRALDAYARLCRLGLDALSDGGHFVMASCSSRVSRETFRETVVNAAEAHGRPLSIERETGHPLDHPIGFAEGAYLKCLYARA